MDPFELRSGTGGKAWLGGLALLVLTLSGCATVPSPVLKDPPPAIEISLSLSSVTVQTSATQKFNVTVKNTANTGVTWQVNGVVGGDSVHGTMAADGTYTAPASIPNPATVTVTAIAQADTSKTASAQVTIIAPPAISVAVSPASASIQTGQTQNFTATLQNDTQNMGVNWTLTGAGCTGTACGKMSASSSTSGVAITYTAPVILPSPATITLTATSAADKTKSAPATITITAPAPAITVAIGPTSANVQAGIGMQNFSATLQNDSQNKGVSWALSGTGCSGATCGTLANITSSAVTYSAPASVPNSAQVTLTATSIADNTKTATASITVTAPVSVVLAPTSASLNVGKTQQFTPTVTNDSQNKGVTWQVNGIAGGNSTVGTISATGLYTAPASVPSPAAVTVQALSVADPSRSASAAVTVLGAVSVSVLPATQSVQVGLTQNFTASLSNDPGNQGVTWALSGAGCSGATCGALSNVTSTGVTYTAPAAVPTPAAVTLTATSVRDNTKSAPAAITITAAPLPITVAVAPVSANVQAGIGTQGFTATLQNDTQNKGVNWSLSGAGCSGASCGSLSNVTTTSVTYAAPVNAPSPGVVTLTATSIADGTKTGAATITITAPISVSLAPTSASLNVGNTQQFTATVSNDSQNKGATWQVNGIAGGNSAVGTISAAGLYTAPASVPSPATVTVQAVSLADPTRSASATVNVLPAVAVSVSPATQTVQVNLTQNFAASVSNDPGNQGVTWAISGTGCSGATCGGLSNVTSTGVTYTAPAAAPTPAAVTLTATSVRDNTKNGTAAITVTTLPNIIVAVAPLSASVQAGIGTQNFTATLQNDSQNKGVSWSLTGAGCSGATCGTFTNSTTTSVTYNAPPSSPSPATVTLTATSIADGTKTSAGTITITAPISVTLAPTSTSINVGRTQQFTPTVSNDSQSKGVTWQVNGVAGGNSTVGIISASGLYTAPANVPSPPAVTVLAVSVADPTRSASATVTVLPAVGVTVLPPTPSVQVSLTQNFTASVTNDPGNQGVTWALSGTGCSGATCGSLSNVTPTGVTYAAPAIVPTPASVTLTAASVRDNTKNGTAAITITPVPAILVTIAPTSASVQAGIGTQNFSATLQNDSQNKGVSWSLSGAGCSGASCGTLSNVTATSATYSAPATPPSPAAVTLTATSVADGTKSSAATITVTAAISVTLAPTSASINIGKTQQFTATVSNDSQNKGVTWEVNGVAGGNATVGTISAAGLYTAPAAVPSPATVMVQGVSVADPTRSGSATVTVLPAVAVSVSPATPSVQVNLTQNFTASVTNDPGSQGVTWALSGAGCNGATCGTLSNVSMTAVTYTSPGTAPTPAAVTLTATSVRDNTKSGTAAITVTPVPAIVVTLAPTSASVQAGIGTQGFTATLQNDSQNKGVSWSLSGAGCSGATCGSLSNVTTTSVTYTAPANVPSPATATLTATSIADGTKFSAAAISITAPVSVVVAPTAATVQVGQPNNFTATVSNDTQNKGVTWTLSGAGCTGNTCGTLSASSSASGAAIIYTAPASVPTPAIVTLAATSVTDGARTAAAVITIAQATGNVTVSISPKRAGVTTGQTQQFSATVTGSSNTNVAWQVDSTTGGNSTIGTIDGTGKYTPPSSAGTHTVTATSVADVTKSASASIAVTDLAGVTTYHNDLSRDGVNAQEYALTTAIVTKTTFGKLFSCTADGAIYAQPLWMANLSISGGTHNVVFAATTHDTVYAFDADTSPCVTYWNKSLLGSGETWVDFNDVGTGDTQPDIGIIGTPVIDPASNTLYVVSKSKVQGTNCTPASSCHQRLHALSLIDGSEKFGGPVDITSAISVLGTGDGTSGGRVAFNTLRENQRPGLVLSRGVVYVSWASHGDNPPYHGWVIGYDASTLALGPIFNANPNGSDAGIWMSGGAPSADAAGNLYFLTGNGTFDADSGGLDYGDSTVKLSTSGGLSVAGFFTPADQSSLNGGDTDHGAGGAAILVDQPATAPHQHLMIGGGKEGNLFLLDRDNLGGYGANFNPADSNAVQKFSIGNGIFSTAAFFNNSLYIAGREGQLKAFAFNTATGLFNTSQTSQSSNTFRFPGATPSVSAAGTNNGIVWALDNSQYCTQQSPTCGPAVLHAYDATNLGTELWNSSQGSGNAAGNAVKFTVPTVANGKVYVGTRGNSSSTSGTVNGEVDVYGLLPN